ncbi:hypothetical protein ABK040_000663 [Willaertia magna]
MSKVTLEILKDYSFQYEAVLDDEETKLILREFMKSIKCEENLFFLERLLHYHQKRSANNKWQLLQTIYKEFFTNDSDLELNLSQSLKDPFIKEYLNVIKLLKQNNNDILQINFNTLEELLLKVENSILLIVKGHVFPQFIESNYFKDFILQKNKNYLSRIGVVKALSHSHFVETLMDMTTKEITLDQLKMIKRFSLCGNIKESSKDNSNIPNNTTVTSSNTKLGEDKKVKMTTNTKESDNGVTTNVNTNRTSVDSANSNVSDSSNTSKGSSSSNGSSLLDGFWLPLIQEDNYVAYVSAKKFKLGDDINGTNQGGIHFFKYDIKFPYELDFVMNTLLNCNNRLEFDEMLKSLHQFHYNPKEEKGNVLKLATTLTQETYNFRWPLSQRVYHFTNTMVYDTTDKIYIQAKKSCEIPEEYITKNIKKEIDNSVKALNFGAWLFQSIDNDPVYKCRYIQLVATDTKGFIPLSIAEKIIKSRAKNFGKKLVKFLEKQKEMVDKNLKQTDNKINSLGVLETLKENGNFEL